MSLLIGYIDPSNVIDREIGESFLKCYLRNKTFKIYGSIFAFVIPLIIMKLMFLLSVRKLREQMMKLECNTQQYSSVSDVPSDCHERDSNSHAVVKSKKTEIQLRRHQSTVSFLIQIK